MAENKQASGKILFLEGLRGLCALSVLLSHVFYNSMGYRTSHETYFPGYIGAFISASSCIGVLLFFVLSGFVIEYTTQRPFSGIEVKKYLARRFIRIYPIYILVLIFSFAISSNASDTWERFAGNALFLQTWAVECLSNNTVFWTLHLEVAFYLLYLLVWRFKPKIEYLLICTAICALVSPFVQSHILRVFGYFFLWLCGLSLAREYLKKPTASIQNHPWRWFWASVFAAVAFNMLNVIQISIKPYWICGRGFTSLISVVVVSGCLMTILAVPLGLKIRSLYKVSILISFIASLAAVLHSLLHHRWSHFTEYPLASAYLVLTFFGFAYGQNISALKWLDNLTWLGAVSYAVYIIQEPIYTLVFSFIPISWASYSWWGINVLVIALTFLSSSYLENIYQPWIGSRIKRILLKQN